MSNPEQWWAEVQELVAEVDSGRSSIEQNSRPILSGLASLSLAVPLQSDFWKMFADWGMNGWAQALMDSPSQNSWSVFLYQLKELAPEGALD